MNVSHGRVESCLRSAVQAYSALRPATSLVARASPARPSACPTARAPASVTVRDAGSRVMRRLALVVAPLLVIASDASIGAAGLTRDLAQRLGIRATSGVVITSVTPNSSTATSGLRPRQVVLQTNGHDTGSEGLRSLARVGELGRTSPRSTQYAGPSRIVASPPAASPRAARRSQTPPVPADPSPAPGTSRSASGRSCAAGSISGSPAPPSLGPA
jgi:hypothetical protein